ARVMLELTEAISERLAGRRASDVPASSINVGVVSGGESPNMVPPSCTFVVDRRLIPGESPEAALEEITEICRPIATVNDLGIRVRGIRSVHPYSADPRSRLS